MANQYETVFIMTPVLSEEQMKETVQKFEKVLTDKGAEIVHQENWGLRKLEYPIQKKSSGFYHLIEFKAEGSVVEALELQYRRDERIMRFLTVSMDKYAIAYAEKRRANRKEKAAAKEEVKEETPVVEQPQEVNNESNQTEQAE
ncbi:MAG: 30S ribosomal protein S6 [Bacteroidales bacterium]|jgi:small subunit ribosomal protein S6|nr:30S ribosomal protein S6 [Bacteroidales bacterium]